MSRLRDRLDRAFVRLAGRLPARLQISLAGRCDRIDGQQLHPELRLVNRLLALAGDIPFQELPVEQARTLLERQAWLFAGRPIPVGSVREVTLPGPAGPLQARLYTPDPSSETSPLLVYFHGGGMALGSLDSHDNICRFLARNAGVKVLSVAYRLAPEHTFPAAPDDAYAGFRFAVDNAAELGADPDRIAVGGDSAGATLAAVVCQTARAAGDGQPAFQMLLVPCTDITVKRPSVSLFADGFILTEALIDWYMSLYLRSPDDAFDPRVSPALAPDLSGLPPAYVATAGFDPLRDDGADYARRLRDAGVPVVLREHPQLMHPFASALGYGRTGAGALLEAAAALRAGLVSVPAGGRPRW